MVSMKKVTPPPSTTFARIRVVGVGGSGKNVTNHMIKAKIGDVDFIVANTDSQDLKQSKAQKKIHIGQQTTHGLGTGMDPSLGRSAAEESSKEINEALKGADLVFIACGMGGGTGTGAAPVIAQIAKNLNILTVAVITTPFSFEGGKRKEIAEEGLQEIAKYVDSLVVIPNDNILSSVSERTSMSEAFAMSDDVLLQAVAGITRLILKPGEINIDFADVRAIMENSGTTLFGVGKARGANRAEVAVSNAISSPLLDVSIRGANRLLFSISSRTKTDLSMLEVQTIAERITESADPNARIIFGTSIDKDLKQGEIAVTLIATVLKDEQQIGHISAQQPLENHPTKPIERISVSGAPTQKVDEREYEDFENADDKQQDTKWNVWKRK